MDTNFNFKQKIAEYAWLVALFFGVIAFGVAYLVLTALAGQGWLVSLLVALGFLVIVAIATWLMASNVVDSYTLESAEHMQDVYVWVQKIRGKSGLIKDTTVRKILADMCKHVEDLAKFTFKRQPDTVLSLAQVLEKWLEMVFKLLEQYLDIQTEPSYARDPQASFNKAKTAFEGFDLFLTNSIRTIVDGQSVEFETAAKMLDASRYTIV